MLAWKLGDERGPMDAAAFCVTGVTLSAHQARFAWQTLSVPPDVRGSLATNGGPWTPRPFA